MTNKKEKKPFLFNKIANIYGLFFNRQVREYSLILNSVKDEFDPYNYESVLDIGCGTGALCKVLQGYNLQVTGIDPAEAMIKVAMKKTGTIEKNKHPIKFICGDVLKGLAFEDKLFDFSITSYVAHGLILEEREILFKEMKRVSKQTIVIFDYNEQRSLLTDIVESLEGGDYFNFISSIRNELKKEFGNLEVINTGKRSALYICRID